MPEVVVSGPAKHTLIDLAATDTFRYQALAAMLLRLGTDPEPEGSRPIDDPDGGGDGERILRHGPWEILYRLDAARTKVEVALIRRV